MEKCQKWCCSKKNVVEWSISGMSDETKQRLRDHAKMLKKIGVSAQDFNQKNNHTHEDKYGMPHAKCEEVFYNHGYVSLKKGVDIADFMEHLKISKLQKKKHTFDQRLGDALHKAFGDPVVEFVADKVLPTKITIDDVEQPEETTEIELAREHARKEVVDQVFQILDAHIDYHKLSAERAKKDKLYHIAARNEAIASAQIRLIGELHRKLSTKNV